MIGLKPNTFMWDTLGENRYKSALNIQGYVYKNGQLPSSMLITIALGLSSSLKLTS
jgi:hypothetical protein